MSRVLLALLKALLLARSAAAGLDGSPRGPTFKTVGDTGPPLTGPEADARRLSESEPPQLSCSLNGLQELVARESYSILSHFGQFQEYLEVARVMMERWMNSDQPQTGVAAVPGTITIDDLVHQQFPYGSAYTYKKEGEPCGPDEGPFHYVQRCDPYRVIGNTEKGGWGNHTDASAVADQNNCRCTKQHNETDAAAIATYCDGYPDVNCHYWADRRHPRVMELYIAGWGYNYTYDVDKVSADSKAGLYYGNFAKPHQKNYTKREPGRISEWCALKFPDCPTDTLANPISVAKWTADGSRISVQPTECYGDADCKADNLDGKPLCPRPCLDPMQFDDNFLNFILAFSSPLWAMFSDLYERYKADAIAWYWWGNRGEGLYFPGFAPYDMGDFIEWDFQYPKMHFAGPHYEPTRRTAWSPTYLDGVSGNLMISPMTPVYIGDYWQGVVSIDITMVKTDKIVKNIKGTDSGFAILITARGNVVAAAEDTYNILFCPNRNEPECTCYEEWRALKDSEIPPPCPPGSPKNYFAVDKSWNPEIQANKGKQGAEGVKIQQAAYYKGQVQQFINEQVLQTAKGMQQVQFCPNATEPAENDTADPGSCTSVWWGVWQTLEGKWADYLPWKLLMLVPKEEMDTAAVWSVAKPIVTMPVQPAANDASQVVSSVVTVTNSGKEPVDWGITEAPGMTGTPVNGTLTSGQSVDITVTFAMDQVVLRPADNSAVFRIQPLGESRACFPIIDTTFLFETVCPKGSHAVMLENTTTRTCVPTDPGYYQPQDGPGGQIACAPGSFCEGGGCINCQVCPPGRYQNASAALGCIDCPNGTAVRSSGATVCPSCKEGTYMAAGGQTSCLDCDIGFYQSLTRQLACEPCQGIRRGSVTASPGAYSSDQCTCPSETYTFGQECKPCTEGMFCGALGMGEPQQEEGYKVERIGGNASTRDVEMSVYKCRAERDCPRSELGTCSIGHTGTACGTCMSGYFKGGDGECLDCEGAGDMTVTVIVAVLLGVMAICAVVVVMRGSTKERTTSITAGLAVGQLIFALQTMGVYRQMSILWPEPIVSMLSVLKIFSFDVEVLRFSCIIGQNDIVTQFAFQLVGVPVVMAILAILTKVASILRRKPFDCPQYWNLVGLAMMVCYVTIAVAMMQPLYCVSHPNNKRSMVANFSVLCWESSEHTALVVMSVIGTLAYPITLLAMVGGATWRYPSLVASGQGMRMLSAFNFIFKRFTPESYFWGAFYLLRNLLIAATPVLVPDSASWQVIIVSVILTVAVAWEACLMPWRTRLANVSNIVCLVSLLIFLQAAAALITVEDTTFIGTILCVLLLSLLLGLLGFAACGVYGTLFPGNKYDVFLCHHKDGAGSWARWIKIQIMARKPKSLIFLDSDCLEELDLIVDMVATRTKKLAILGSRLVLTRPWCAAEVTSAVENKIPIVKIQFEDWEVKGKESIDSLMSGWSEEQKTALARYSVTPEKVKAAFEEIWDRESVPFLRMESGAKQAECLSAVLKAITGSDFAAPKSARTLPAKIVVLGASEDAEARYTCEVMAVLLQKKLEVPVSTVHATSDASVHNESALYMMVMITRGLLKDDTFMGVLLKYCNLVRDVPVEIVTALADSNFSFPSPQSLADMDPETGSALKKVFNILALPFSSLGSETIQAVQVSEISRRFSKLDRAVKVVGPDPVRTKEEEDYYQPMEV